MTKIKGGTHQSAEILKVFYQSLETTKSYLDRKFLCGIFWTNWLTDWLTDEWTSSNSIAMGMVGKKTLIINEWKWINEWKRVVRKNLVTLKRDAIKDAIRDAIRDAILRSHPLNGSDSNRISGIFSRDAIRKNNRILGKILVLSLPPLVRVCACFIF